jgi:inosine-uridine nucleoside N-ribohydrolase
MGTKVSYMSGKIQMIVDCDPGHDDAMALVVAARHADVLGVTTVAGNAPLHSTTRNARIVLDLIGSQITVHSGASRPLVAPPHDASHVHGKSGLDGADLPEPSRGPDSENAVEFIIETCRANEGVWLVPIGPLTNIALALRAAPDLGSRIAGISLMGGGTFGNVTAAAEFNIWADPEAADIVFTYGGKLLMSGLDVTHQLQATPSRLARIREIPGKMPQVLADLLAFYSKSYINSHRDMTGAAVHDPCAVLALTHPELFSISPEHVVIELTAEHTRGMTLVDRRQYSKPVAPNCDVVWGVEDEPAFDVLIEAIRFFA